jgi:hypothetical protein
MDFVAAAVPTTRDQLKLAFVPKAAAFAQDPYGLKTGVRSGRLSFRATANSPTEIG